MRDRDTPPTGTTIESGGGTYFELGKTRIKVTEHFAPTGKPLPVLLEDLIRYVSEHSDTS